MTVLCAAPGFSARVASGYQPDRPLERRMQPAPRGGPLIVANCTRLLPDIQRRPNPILDTLDRSYLYADSIAVNDGQQQVRFNLNEPVCLTDSMGPVPRCGFARWWARPACSTTATSVDPQAVARPAGLLCAELAGWVAE